MLTAVVTRSTTSQPEVTLFVTAEDGAEEEFHPEDCEFEPETEGATECGEGPSPIMPEGKELLWSAGAFVVFALLMRFVLFPRLKKGMEQRYSNIRGEIESADALTAAAIADVARYEAQLAEVRAEAHQRVEAARAQLDAERAERLAAVNPRIAERRAAAMAEIDAARAAAESQVRSAVATVVARAVELAIGRRPDDAVVDPAVADAMSMGVRS